MDFLIVLASVIDLFIKVPLSLSLVYDHSKPQRVVKTAGVQGFSGTESSGVSVLRLLRVLRVRAAYLPLAANPENEGSLLLEWISEWPMVSRCDMSV